MTPTPPYYGMSFHQINFINQIAEQELTFHEANDRIENYNKQARADRLARGDKRASSLKVALITLLAMLVPPTLALVMATVT